MTHLRLPTVALALLVSSTAWADLKTYDVDPQLRQEVYQALNRILSSSEAAVGGASYGRVQLLPTGQLLVNAPAETLTQVEQVLQVIRNRPAPAAPRVDLRYWAVLGSRAPVANPPGTPTPTALGPVLAELKRLHGDLQFRVIGSAALATESGQEGQVNGMALRVKQTAFVQGEALNARIEMNLSSKLPTAGPPGGIDVGSNISVRTPLRGGEFVVLGQSEVVGGGLDGPVFFIVHWPEGAR
jgi:hypothetical protein